MYPSARCVPALCSRNEAITGRASAVEIARPMLEAAAAPPPEHRGVDADDFAGRVDERSAGIARRDRGVGLDQSVERAVLRHHRAVESRHDAERDRRLTVEIEREADRHHLVANADRVGIGEASGREPGPGDAEERKVVADVDRDQSRLAWFGLPGQSHADLRSIGDHVSVRDDLTIRRRDDATADRLARVITLADVGADRDDRRSDRCRDGGDVDPRETDTGSAMSMVGATALRVAQECGR